MELKNKVVLITGSSNGAGKEVALVFAKKGAHVVVTYYNKDEKSGKEVFEKCGKSNESFLIHLDVTSKESIKNCLKKVINKFNHIDILINNAGFLTIKKLEEQSEKEIKDQININLLGLINMTKSSLPYLRKKGTIINISSGCGEIGKKELTVYSASKFGVVGFTQALSKELLDKKIYSINYGRVATRLTNFIGNDPKEIAKLIPKIFEGKIKMKSGENLNIWKFLEDSKIN